MKLYTIKLENMNYDELRELQKLVNKQCEDKFKQMQYKFQYKIKEVQKFLDEHDFEMICWVGNGWVPVKTGNEVSIREKK